MRSKPRKRSEVTPAERVSSSEREAGQSREAQQSKEQLEELQEEVLDVNQQIADPEEKRRIVRSQPC